MNCSSGWPHFSVVHRGGVANRPPSGVHYRLGIESGVFCSVTRLAEVIADLLRKDRIGS
jgi:hypothetical protein